MKRFRNTDYYIDINGDVYSFRFNKKKKLKQQTINSGYKQVEFKINKKRCPKLVHRLVAECYLSNYNNELQVNHINGDKSDNRLINLEMNTCKENISHYKSLIDENPYIFEVEYNGISVKLDTLKEVADYVGYKSRGSVYNPLSFKNEHITNKGYKISKYFL